jgi:hypothetical protein
MILPEMHSFIIFLTKYHKNASEISEIYWAFDVVFAWMHLFKWSTDIHILFHEDRDLLYHILELFKCTPRGTFIPYNEYDSTLLSTCNIYIHATLPKIDGGVPYTLCFYYIYPTVFEENIHFRNLAYTHWPFILGEDGELLGVNIILEKLQQMIKEENYPKSANKK